MHSLCPACWLFALVFAGCAGASLPTLGLHATRTVRERGGGPAAPRSQHASLALFADVSFRFGDQHAPLAAPRAPEPTTDADSGLPPAAAPACEDPTLCAWEHGAVHQTLARLEHGDLL